MPVRTKDIPELDTSYARDVSFPIRFTEECDVLLDEDQEVIEQALQMITFISSGSVRLYPQFGSAAHLVVFDQLDEGSSIILDTSLRTAFESLESRVILDKEFIVDESADELKFIVIVPYRIRVTGELAATRLVIDRPISG